MSRSIDIGSTDGGLESRYATRTYIDERNQANATGIITYIYISSNTVLENVKIAAFYKVSTDHFTTRGYVELGHASEEICSWNAEDGDFEPFIVRTGDYLGIYYSSGWFSGDRLGSDGGWVIGGDHIPCTNYSFSSVDHVRVPIYAEGYQLGKINIGDSWKTVQNIKINIGDAWKQFLTGEINISDTWKDIHH